MPSDLDESSPSEALPDDPPLGGERLVLRDMLATFERDLIVTVLLAAGGNQKRAAKALGVLPTTFQEKLKRFGLINPRPGVRARRGERARPRGRGVPTDGIHHPPPTEDQE